MFPIISIIRLVRKKQLTIDTFHITMHLFLPICVVWERARFHQKGRSVSLWTGISNNAWDKGFLNQLCCLCLQFLIGGRDFLPFYIRDSHSANNHQYAVTTTQRRQNDGTERRLSSCSLLWIFTIKYIKLGFTFPHWVAV